MTHLQLLSKLPSPIREQAIAEFIENKGNKWLHANATKLLPSLVWMIMKFNGNKQYNYWQSTYLSAINGEFDDPSVTLLREDWEELIETAQKGRCSPKLIEAIESQLNNN